MLMRFSFAAARFHMSDLFVRNADGILEFVADQGEFSS